MSNEQHQHGMDAIHPRCGGFTMIEILIVIAIIGILSSLVFTAVSMVHTSARTLACASNLRQIGMASGAYSLDNRGFLVPSSVDMTVAGIPSTRLWPDNLRPYMTVDGLTNNQKKDSVFRCADNTMKTVVLNGDGGANNSSNYGKNAWSGLSWGTDIPPQRWSAFTDSSSTIFIGDSSDQSANGNQQNNRELCAWAVGDLFGLDFIHRNGVNLLMADMHVERRMQAQIPLSRNPASPSFFNTALVDSGYPTWQPYAGPAKFFVQGYHY